MKTLLISAVFPKAASRSRWVLIWLEKGYCLYKAVASLSQPCTEQYWHPEPKAALPLPNAKTNKCCLAYGFDVLALHDNTRGKVRIKREQESFLASRCTMLKKKQKKKQPPLEFILGGQLKFLHIDHLILLITVNFSQAFNLIRESVVSNH